MIEQQGRVVAVVDDRAIVRVGGQSGCTACDAGKGCGAGLFGRLLRCEPVELSLANTVTARAGDPVWLCIPEHRFLAMTAQLFALPLLAGLAGAFCAALVLPPSTDGAVADIVTGIAGLLAASVALLWARRRLPGSLEPLGIEIRAVATPVLDCAVTNHH
ncbi:SoxR reducing system RseC family protein [Marinihelvus fidelis]|uniref:SoxR reducing system RseC family protein n=1 Tax=Marinihelvus fidelis TaxID=2613842 RepID=A0A5N0TGL8_9GAMM|nr:SoxR reducing system RseC family protein [Marinihelvus fidelis]KAA9133277.1 SoxR reducing system RseC family protein [Marinihelvus fidelis]